MYSRSLGLAGRHHPPIFLSLLICAALALSFDPRAAASTAGGRQLWAAFYHPSTSAARAVALSPDGSRVFVTGWSNNFPSGPGSDYATVAYDASTGVELWVARYHGPSTGPSSFDTPTALGVSQDGSKVFVTGRSRGVGTGYDYATVAYDAASGTQLWVTRYNDSGNGRDVARALTVSPDGQTVLVTGESAETTTCCDFDFDYATVAYDAATGARLWIRRYNGPANTSDAASSIAASPDGRAVFVTGASSGSYASVAYSVATGATLWTSRYVSGSGGAFSVGVSPDGRFVVVTGFSARGVGSFDYATVAYDAATGAKIWARRYNGPANGDDEARSLAVSPDGSKVFVTGFSQETTACCNYDYATVAYETATGGRLWVRRYNGPGNGTDMARAVAVSGDGSRVFVTGRSQGILSGSDYATIAYDASTGATGWVTRFNGPGNNFDAAAALAVSVDGTRVFVTGTSRVTRFGPAFGTVTYAG